MTRQTTLRNVALLVALGVARVLPAAGASPACQTTCPSGGHQPKPRPVYSVPATATYPVSRPAPPTPDEQAREQVLAARRAFEQQNYQAALERMDVAVKLVPKNADARQFRSLILFAMADYKQAAAEAYDAVLLGPLWTWETLRSVYADKQLYTRQYRKLQTAAAARPDSLEVHFLLACHYLMLGHLQHGEAELVKVLQIKPGEPVSTRLLEVVRQTQDDAAQVAGRTRK